jgi:hypothetical protein
MDDQPRQALKDHTERLRSDRAEINEHSSKVFKARQDFYQHLMFLNAGTLPQSATLVLVLAATGHPKAVHIYDTRPLPRGCGMLLAAILLSLIHNHLNISFFINFKGAQLNLAGSQDVQNLHKSLIDCGIKPPDLGSPAGLKALGDHHEKVALYIEAIHRWFGPLAQLLTCVAHIEFVCSMSAIISSVAM